MTPPLLQVENLQVAFSTRHGVVNALHGIDITLEGSETLGIVGESGSGKSVTGFAITRLLDAAGRITAGHIRFRGEEITSLAPHRRARRGIGYAPENSGLFPELTVAENLMISGWLAAKTERGAQAEANTERLYTVFPEVRQLTARQGMNLSGGQKKMVAITRAMALAPYLLILDEAFEGLAPAVVKRFRDAVMMIKGMGISLLIAESNLTSAAAIADRLYVVDRGEIVFRGTPQEALADEEVMRALRG